MWDTYIVHMDLSAMPKASSDHHNWYASALSSVRHYPQISTTATTRSMDIIYTYSNVMHGFSASLSLSELESVRNLPGFVSSYRDLLVRVDTTRAPQFLNLNSNYGAWPTSNYGEDVIIGVVDTGVWPESKSYSDEGLGEIPSRWKGECMEGTEFSSSMCNKKLIGAKFFNKGLISNMPNITITMNSTRDTYFIHRCREFCRRCIVLRICQRDSKRNGTNGPWEEAMEKGIFVATSAGNEGPWFGTLHNGIPWVLTVSADDSVGGQVDNVAGGLFISNTTLIDFFLESSFPAVFINPKDGQSILNYMKMNSDPSASLQFQKTRLGRRRNKPAPRVADYSSRGPSHSCPFVLKPDIMAPGTLVLAAWPRTTVAPMAGIGALLKGVHPEWSAAAIRSALMTTADTLDNSNSFIKDIGDNYQPASPLAMGSGHVNPNKAMDPGLIYDTNAEDYVNLLLL
ncbi:hypothetical protein C5167_016885 [Papaver somniferum]|uniref:Peptidase S8/S53 domain-containing protein n=1 Tax=Papaver somniferum TaxID=3469 RepID=A0A4Y7IHT1_PAPSO|nr:hypothetical protein C5167_016885 [Papaver somniferum]